MLFPPVDPNERFRERRAASRRRKRLRRGAVIAAVLGVIAFLGVGARWMGGGSTPPEAVNLSTLPSTPKSGPRALPIELRGVHVTAALASLPGKLDEYLDLDRKGLTALELDIKDEQGEVGFGPASSRLASAIGAARSYYKPSAVARRAHARGLYLIGRIVVFEDPVLSRARPDLAIRRSDGSVWKDSAGLGWVNPYDKRVWDYNVGLAVAAARAGFDEIMFDYVRFPSDGDLSRAVYPGRTTQKRKQLITDFVAYASRRLEPLGVRVSTALFGLSASRDMGLGQAPKLIAEHVDTISPMAYPALYNDGELGIESPSTEPGETVFRTLGDFRRAVGSSGPQLVPWIQDWNYSPREVRQQIEAVRLMGAKGYLLWNAAGRYTTSALAAPPTG